jgi:ribosome maturation factor RimP
LVVVDVESMVRPVVESAGLELFDVAYDRAGGRRVLRVTVDRKGDLDLDTIATVSDAIARRLDLEGFGDGRYELEVSSPGIEHPLRTPAQFARAIDSTVRIKTTAPVDGARVHVGTLRVADADSVSIEIDGETRRLQMAEITAARTIADWSAELKGSRA